MIYKIGVLMTIHNRIETTLSCLDSLLKNKSKDIIIEVFITNSGSKYDLDKKKYSDCTLIKVNENTYWNHGMYLAWNLAIQSGKTFDFFLLLNDDTFLKPNSLECLIKDFLSANNEKVIIVGSTNYKNEITYGGRKSINENPITPNGIIQEIKFMNGNCVLVPNLVFKTLGNLNLKYTHSLGDFDYGIRAIRKNIKLFNSSQIIGECKPNKLFWYQNKNIVNRFRALSNPKGLPFFEYLYFNIYNLGVLRGLIFILSTMLIILNPKIYEKVKSL
jgi:GT2 family glycosyltransferase